MRKQKDAGSIPATAAVFVFVFSEKVPKSGCETFCQIDAKAVIKYSLSDFAV
jgi:hypothetical protein